MTKKDYERLAIAFQDAAPAATTTEAFQQWEKDIRKISEALRYDNARFVSGRFRAACEPGANVKARHGY